MPVDNFFSNWVPVPFLFLLKGLFINMKNDEESRIWVANWLNEQPFVISAWTFTEENAGPDIVYITSAGTHECELKTRRKTHDYQLTSDNPNVSFTNIPKKSDTNTTFDNWFEGDNIFRYAPRGEEPERFKGKKIYYLNADSSKGEFMKEHADQRFDVKWLKVLKQKETLIILFMDGLYLIDNPTLRKQFIGYFRYRQKEWENNTAYYNGDSNNMRWSIKAGIDLSGIEFIEIDDVPLSIFNKN